MSKTADNRVKYAVKNRSRRHRRDVNRTPVTTHVPRNPSPFAAMAAGARRQAEQRATEQAEWDKAMADAAAYFANADEDGLVDGLDPVLELAMHRRMEGLA